MQPNTPDSLLKVNYVTDALATGQRVKTKSAIFTKSKSLFTLKSYLTFELEGKIPRSIIIVANEFFLSKAVKTGISPKVYTGYMGNYGNVFYTSKKTKFAKVAKGMGIAAVLAGAVAITPAETVEE